MRLLLFDGQGTVSGTSSASSTLVPPVLPPSSPLAALFVRQAHAAFRARLSVLPPSALDALDSPATRAIIIQLREGSLSLPTSDAELLVQPLISLPSVYVSQVVRLLEEVEVHPERLLGESLEVVGYSSGLLSALLVATSLPPASDLASLPLPPAAQLSFLSNALALFDLSVTLGIHVQLSRLQMFEARGVTLDDPVRDKEWCVVIFGISRGALEDKVNEWNRAQAEDGLLQVFLTAQTTPTCHTLSGLPSVLRRFIASFSSPASGVSPVSNFSFSSSLSSSGSITDSDVSAQSLSPFSASGCSPATSPASSQTDLHAPCLNGLREDHLNALKLSSMSSSSSVLSNESNTPTMPVMSLPPLPIPAQLKPSAIKPVAIFTLFHADIMQLHSARDRVLADVFTTSSNQLTNMLLDSNNSTQDSNNGNTYANETSAALRALRLTRGCTLFDTRTAQAIHEDLIGERLIERILDLILLERVEFNDVLQTLSMKAKVFPESGIELLNFGPGSSLARVTMRALKENVPCHISLIDASVASVPLPKTVRPRTDAQEPIAIVGMAANFPGARDTNELWRLLEQGINTVQEIPETRFSIGPYTAPNANPNRKMRTRFGSFLPDSLHSSFDNAFFRISPREARALDPQIRVLMRVGLQAMEAAGLVVEDFQANDSAANLDESEGALKSEDVGCFVGVATNDYVFNLRKEVGVHYATGTLPAFLAGRLAYALHISGPSLVLNTACSSSLVAVHQACRALLSGDCKAALAGGVNVVTSPDMYLGLDRAHFLSPTGNCKPWDASADGYCRAEGCGIFVLKRLSDALASYDNILGVIRGTEVNQSAAAASITRPHAPTQSALFRSLFDKTGVKPEEISLVEAHGTGTQAGDPEELKSIRDALSPKGGSKRSRENMLTVTSIKGNIGHAEAASGAASLAKVLLMFRNQSLPPQIGLVNLNPKIEPLENDFTRINSGKECLEWSVNTNRKRIALVNNFGAAGSNAALIVEEASASINVGEMKDAQDQVLLGLSAETEEALVRLRDTYISTITDKKLVEFSYTATARRKLRPWRMAVSADSASGLTKVLSNTRPVRAPQDESAGCIVFVFSGQGGQHLGMGRQLYRISRTFRSVVDGCHAKLISWGYPGVIPIINAEGESSGLEKHDELIAFQCAIFVLECALCTLWQSWGVKPGAVIGHSLGEYAALVAADVMNLDTGLRLVAHRAYLMTQCCEHGASGMLVVRLPAQTIFDTIMKLEGCEALSVSCYNGAKDNVIGGPLDQLAILKAHFDGIGAKCFSVNVPFAYHTAAMAPILDELASYARKFDFKAPSITVVSNVVGKAVMSGDRTVFNSEYFASHCRLPVRFEEGANDLADAFESIAAFIEIGPHPTTLPMLSHLNSSTGAISLHSLHKKSTARTSLNTSLSRLFVTRSDVAWGKVFRELYPAAHCIEIPGYPLSETEFWAPYVEETPALPQDVEAPQPAIRFPFLGSWTQKPSSQDANVSEFETSIQTLAEYISGHSVSSFPMCPASLYFELALSAATLTLEETDESFANDVLALSEVQFTHPIIYTSDVPLVIRTTINLHPRGGKHAGTFTISSVLNGREHHQHCTGFFQRRLLTTASSKLQLHSAAVERGKAALLNPTGGVHHETLRTRTIYDLVFPRVVRYSKLYQVIQKMTLDEQKGEGFATVQLSNNQINKAFAAQPIFVDALLHAAGFLINSHAPVGDAYICGQVDSTKMLFDIDYSAAYEIYCMTTSSTEGVIFSDAWAIQAGESGRVVAHLKRMRFSRVRLVSLTRLLARSAEALGPIESPVHSVTAVGALPSPEPGNRTQTFRPSHRSKTPSVSMMSSVTAVNGGADLASDIFKLVAEVCGVPVRNVGLSSNIADLGVDSLIWIEFVGHLKSIVPGASFDVSELMLSQTVNDLVSKVSKVDQRATSPPKGLKVTFADEENTESVMVKRVMIPVDEDASVPVQVKNILGKVLDMSARSLRDVDALDALGLDSLGSIEALHDLQQEFSLSLPQDFFQAHPTIGAVQTYITNARAPRCISRQSSYSKLSDDEPVVKSEPVAKTVRSMRTLLPLQSPDNDVSPLFLVHDGSGLGHCYARVGDIGRALWGISNPKLLTGERWEGGIPEMAAHYIDLISSNIGEGGCVLGGWSFGGVVAFHMACELMRAGVRVSGVVLIDSPSPFTRKRLPEALIDAVIESEAPNSNEQQAKLGRLARVQMSHATNTLVGYEVPFVAVPAAYPSVVMLRCKEAFPLSSISGISQTQRLSFLEDRSNPKDFVRDWERLVGRDVPVFDIPGHHFEPFHPKNVGALTEQLNNALAHLDSLSD